MIYEVLIKLTGGALLALIHFLPLSLKYDNDSLQINAILTEPVTKECLDVVNQGLHLGINYQMLLIINDAKSYARDTVITISKEDLHVISINKIELEGIQKKMGTIGFGFAPLKLKELDRIEIIVKAKLVADEDFKKSTGFETSILWKYFVPRIKTIYHFEGQHFKTITDK